MYYNIAVNEFFPVAWVCYPLCADDSLSLWFYQLQRMQEGAVCYHQGNQLILRLHLQRYEGLGSYFQREPICHAFNAAQQWE